MNQHQRSNRVRPEIKDSRRLCWYACLFDQPAEITERDKNGQLVTYTEIIRPGAFTRTLSEDHAVVGNIDHDNGSSFATTTDGTLLLQEDPKGLFASCWIPEGEAGDAVIQRVLSGELDGSSFRFGSVKSRSNGGTVERLEVTLADVCLTANPAYPQTHGEVHLRSKDRTAALLSRYRLMKIKARMRKS
jgi:HK97 family phage prohead protease